MSLHVVRRSIKVATACGALSMRSLRAPHASSVIPGGCAAAKIIASITPDSPPANASEASFVHFANVSQGGTRAAATQASADDGSNQEEGHKAGAEKYQASHRYFLSTGLCFTSFPTRALVSRRSHLLRMSAMGGKR